jgi:hypothetical protein
MNNKKMIIVMIVLIISALLMPGNSYSEPSVSIVSGSLKNGSNATISGTDFGTKAPAAPLLWDDGTSAPSLNTHYDCHLPNNAQQGSEYNMQYRRAPYRGVQAPNSRVDYFLAGAHSTDSASDQYDSGGNVVLGKNMTSHVFYIDYYYRIDPVFDEENNPSNPDNMKELALSESAGNAYGGTFGYYNWCNNVVPDINQTGPVLMSRMPADPADRELPYGCSGNNQVYHNNPINDWVKMQWTGGYNLQHDAPTIILTTYPDGARADQSHYGDGLTTDNWWMSSPGYPKLNELEMVSIGGWARIPRLNNGTNSFRYFTAIYMDNTYYRVMLGNQQNYDDCTILEPQIPSSWTDQSISFTVNLGSLPDTGTGYLFVFDSENNHNASGIPVSIEDNLSEALSPPENLRILE